VIFAKREKRVAGGFGAYGRVLSDHASRSFSLAGFIARMPLSMTGLGIVLLISIETGSFGWAGLVTGCATLAGAVTAPLWGRMIDRAGQARVLITAALICNVSLSLLVVTVLAELPLVVTILAAVGVGLGFSSAGSSVRARWAHRLKDDSLLNTAYALEAVVDEMVFIIGPVLVTLLATTFHPGLGLAVCVVLGMAGALWLAAQRSTQPPVMSAHDDHAAAVRLSPGLLVPIVVACASLGALFGGMEVVVVAFATEAGVLRFSGFIVMAWAFGSLISGLVTGTIQWKVSPARRFRVGAVLLALSVLPLPFVSHPALVAVLLTLSGLAIAPTLIASVAVTQEAVPRSRLTEALGWTSTGMAGGVAAGAASLGQVIDRWGAQAGFAGIIAIGLLLILAALCVRTPATPVDAAARRESVTLR
jgi:MFS family permease